MEYYRGLLLLQNYRTLNKTGCGKILKKFEKATDISCSDLYAVKVSSMYFSSSEKLISLKAQSEVSERLKMEGEKEMEREMMMMNTHTHTHVIHFSDPYPLSIQSVFVRAFHNGMEKKGLSELRLPNREGKTHHGVTGRVGFYIGASLPVLVMAIVYAIRNDMNYTEHSILLQVYGSFLLPTIFLGLFSVNMYFWYTHHINYKFIFELDPRDHLEFHQFVEVSSLPFGQCVILRSSPSSSPPIYLDRSRPCFSSSSPTRPSLPLLPLLWIQNGFPYFTFA